MCGNHDPSRILWMGGIPTIKLWVVYDIVLPTLYEIVSPRTIHATSQKHGHYCLGSWWLQQNTTAESWGHSWRLIKEIVCNSGCASLSKHKSTSFKSRIDTLAHTIHCGLAFEGADLQRLAKKLQASGLLAGQLSIVVRNGPRKSSLWNWTFSSVWNGAFKWGISKLPWASNTWANNNSLTWKFRPFWDDSPIKTMIPGFGRTTWGRYNLGHSHYKSSGWKRPRLAMEFELGLKKLPEENRW